MRRVGVVAALTVALSSVALPAHATVGTLPDTDAIYIFNDCLGAGADYQLYSVSPTDAAMTAVGSGWALPNTGVCTSNVVRDEVTGDFYTVAWGDFDPETPAWNYGLGIVNPDTGELEYGPGFSYNGDTEWSAVAQLCAGPDGTIYALGNWELYTVDTTDGTVDMLGNLVGAPHGHSGCAYNPVDETFYVSSSQTNKLYTLDVDTLTMSEVGSLPATAQGFDFDSEGNLWVKASHHLWTGSLDNLAGMTDQGEMTLSGTYKSAQGLFIVKPWTAPPVDDGPVEKSVNEPLAETGFDALPLLVGGAIALGGGVALARRRRRV